MELRQPDGLITTPQGKDGAQGIRFVKVSVGSEPQSPRVGPLEFRDLGDKRGLASASPLAVRPWKGLHLDEVTSSCQASIFFSVK